MTIYAFGCRLAVFGRLRDYGRQGRVDEAEIQIGDAHQRCCSSPPADGQRSQTISAVGLHRTFPPRASTTVRSSACRFLAKRVLPVQLKKASKDSVRTLECQPLLDGQRHEMRIRNEVTGVPMGWILFDFCIEQEIRID